MYNPKFGDEVRIIDGFYEGCTGIVIKRSEYHFDETLLYTVAINKLCGDGNFRKVEETFSVSSLEPIKAKELAWKN